MPIKKEALSPLSLIRLMLPPWRTLDDPLVQYDIRRGTRVGQRPWAVLFITVLTCAAEMLFLVLYAQEADRGNQPLTTEVLPAVIVLLMGGMAGLIMIGHWRLLLAISGRAANMVAGRRARGDWDLIAITPMTKQRWLRSQLTILGWQVFPLVRQLVIVQSLLVLIGFTYISVLRYREIGEFDCFSPPCNSALESTIIYTLAIIPVGIGLALWILVETGMFAAIAFYASSLSQRVTMSMLYSFLGVFALRIFLTFMLIYAGAGIMLSLFVITDALGITESYIEFSDVIEGAVVTTFYACLGAPVLSFFLEWLPALAIIPIAVDTAETDIWVIYLGIWIIGASVYLLLPYLWIRFLTNRTIKRLEKRE